MPLIAVSSNNILLFSFAPLPIPGQKIEEEAGVPECHFSGGILGTGKMVPGRHPKGLVLLTPISSFPTFPQELRHWEGPPVREVACFASKAAGTHGIPIMLGRPG